MEKQHSETRKATIKQVVPWEQRMRYFSRDGMEFGDTPVDLIVLGRIKQPGETWIKRLLQKYSYGDLLLEEGVPLTVERPHDFKQGDIVELQLTITKE